MTARLRDSSILPAVVVGLIVVLLMFAAGVKLVAPVPAGAGLPRWMEHPAAQTMLAVINLLAAGGFFWFRRRIFAWVVIALIFAIFALHSLWLDISGYTRCGCFGIWSLHPRQSFWLDASITALTILAFPRIARGG
jgi:hypothetical protein